MPEEIEITAFRFNELNEYLQMQIMESVAGEFLRAYMDDRIGNSDLKEKIRKAVEADNYKLIKHGIIDLAYDYVRTFCMNRMYLRDGTIIV